MAKDTPEDMKLYDSEITGQLNTFLFAGSDTTAYVIHFPTLHDIDIRSGTIAWALHRLATNPDVQDRLRAECLSYGEGLPFEQMDTLPYLNAVVMETLRMNPSIPSTVNRDPGFWRLWLKPRRSEKL